MENKALAKTEKEKTIKQHTDDLLYQYDILKILYKDIMDEDDWQLLKEAVVFPPNTPRPIRQSAT